MLEQKFPFIMTLLRGLGQIMLQENAATGALFLIGVFYGSTTMGIAAIISVCCGTLTAKILGYDKLEIEKGLYGFSAALVGVALTLYFEPVLIIWLSIILGSIAATVLQHFFISKKIAVFTLPFVLVSWLILLLFQNVYPLAPSVLLDTTFPISHDFTFAFRGFGQVIFQGNLLAGILFCIGVYINSPISALYGIAGAVIGAILSSCFSAPDTGIAMGLFSYNAVLCAIVFAGDKVKDGLWVLLSVILSVLISLIMHQFHLTQLTFPFVAASCITLLLKNTVPFVSEKNNF